VLKVDKISKSFGGLVATYDFSLELGERDIQGVIGPNGAGKTTVFNLITGVYKPDSGNIWLGERETTRLTPDAVARAGISRTFQNIRLFDQMTVLDNIKMAMHDRSGYHFWDAVIASPRFRDRERQIRKEALEFLGRFNLADRRNELAKNLPYGEQRRLEIARALATQPRVLLLDEPAAGMNPTEVADLIELIRRIHRDFNLAILLIEHQMPVVMELCQFVQVMDFGRTIAAGNPGEVTINPLVIKAYLGEEEAAE
jgi:ABC-type branched-chain amino acid transport systems, ATPase component